MRYYVVLVLALLACGKQPETAGPRVKISGPRIMLGAVVGKRLTHYTISVFRCDDCVVLISAQGYPTDDSGNITSPVPFREHRSTKSAIHTMSYPLYLTRGKWFVRTVLFQNGDVVATNVFETEVRDE